MRGEGLGLLAREAIFQLDVPILEEEVLLRLGEVVGLAFLEGGWWREGGELGFCGHFLGFLFCFGR